MQAVKQRPQIRIGIKPVEFFLRPRAAARKRMRVVFFFQPADRPAGSAGFCQNCAGFGQKLFPASECKQCRQERGAFRIGAVPVAAQYAARVAVGKGCGFVPVRQIRQPPLQRFRKCRRLDVCAPRFISPEW